MAKVRKSPANSPSCAVCKKVQIGNLISAEIVRPAVANLIKHDFPEWNASSYICHEDLDDYRTRLIESLLREEKGELSNLEKQVIDGIRNQELAAKNLNERYDSHLTFGEKLSDKIAEFGGSWYFIIVFGLVMIMWIGINIYFLRKPFDPFPFILLNLLLSCLAAIQAPLIMMSQNRQEAKDRLRAEQDYRINLKAEIEIQAIHQKLDHILLQQWERMLEIQQIQIEIMDEIAKSR